MEKFKVGGAVRDYLMGLEPKDVDYVVVGSTPEQMLAAGFQQVGADFPVFLDAHGTEYALARTERKSGHGYGGFTTDHSPSVTLKDDLMRRDLTINAMAQPAGSKAVIDPFNGFADLENKILRHVSPAFADDPVRVLRLARFQARFGPEWRIADETAEFCTQMVQSGELNFLTRERVLKELEKALSEDWADLFFDTLERFGALKVVLPEFESFDSSRFLIDERASVKMKYASMTVFMSDPQAMEDRLGVNTDWQKYSRMWRAMCDNIMKAHPVDVLYAMDAYRQHELWEEMMQDFHAIDFGFSLYGVYEKTKDISFASLSPKEQHTLKGPEIAAAIRERRKKSVGRD